MSEMMISSCAAAEKMKSDITAWRLGRENERLNEGLKTMNERNAALQDEVKALRLELAKARAKNERIYAERIEERTNAKKNGPAQRRMRTIIFLCGMVLSFAVTTGILWAIR